MQNSDKTGSGQTRYEATQGFNPLVRFLHGVRYRYLSRMARALDPSRRWRIVEIGAAHGKSFALLNGLAAIDYLGIEIEAGFCAVARERYSHLPNFAIEHADACLRPDLLAGADVVLALETFEHIPDANLPGLIAAIAAVRPALMIFSVPNEVGPILAVKNVGSAAMGYMRHKEYSWAETANAALYRLDALPAHGTGHKGFDWRRLEALLAEHVEIEAILTSPIEGLPKTLSPSILFICRPRG